MIKSTSTETIEWKEFILYINLIGRL